MLQDGSHQERGDTYRAAAGGTLVADRFVLEEELEQGRFGTVYKAVDLRRSSAEGATRHVALLVLPLEVVRNASLLESFKRGFARLQGLNHPHIVKVFDLERDGALHFVTMEYVDGESLRSIVDSLRPELLWQREAVAVIRAIGDALVYAHARGVVHGDVRLENVVVTAEHDVKVLFTSACFAGTGPFSVEPSDDLHGLARVAYELLAGEPPFLRPTVGANAIEPKRIKSLSRQQWKLLRAILIGRDDRFSGVSEFLEVFGTVGATRSTEKDDETVARPRTAWRWVAAAWVAVLLGALYVLSSDAPEEPAAPLATGTAEPARDPVAVASVLAEPREPQSSESAGAVVPVPQVDGRVVSRESAEVELDSLARNPAAAPSRSAAGAAAGESSVTFVQSSLTVAESEGVAVLELRRSGRLDEPARVVWWASEGTAKLSEDFADLGYVTETFRSGEQSRRILIPIVSDRLVEGREEFRVHMREAGGGVVRLGPITEVTVTVLDDDP